MMSSDQILRGHLVEHVPHIRRIVHRIAKEEGIVDDITQECCVRIIEKEKLWDGNTKKLSQWMNMVSRNLAIHFISNQRKENQKKQTLIEEVVPSQEETNEKISAENIQWVLNQFGSLSEMQKKVLHMKYFKEMRTVDISEELNISYQATATHLDRALKNLKKRGQRSGVDGNFSSLELGFQRSFRRNYYGN